MIKRQVLQTIKKYSMLQPGDKVLIGVSGGPDSVALLLVLKELSKELNFKIFIACLNHMFRKLEAEQDVKFVERLAVRLGAPFIAEKIDVPAICRKEGGSKEDVSCRRWCE